MRDGGREHLIQFSFSVMNNMISSHWYDMGFECVNRGQGVYYIIPKGGEVSQYIARIHVIGDTVRVSNTVEITVVKLNNNDSDEKIILDTIEQFLQSVVFENKLSKPKIINPEIKLPQILP